MVGFLLSLTFGCGLVVAGAHVVNRRFVAPVYDVVANLTAFASAVAASTLLHHWVSAALAALAVCCWLCLARRTLRAIRHREPRRGQAPPPTRPGSVRPAPVVPQQYGRESGRRASPVTARRRGRWYWRTVSGRARQGRSPG